MSRKLTIVLTVMLSMLLLTMVATVPVVADEDVGNIICHMDDGEYTTTALGGLLGTVTTLLVTIAGLIAIVLGAGYTLASAAKPGNEKYIKNRNMAIIYGGGALIVLYGANAITSEFGEDRAMDFSCILPFT